MANLLDVIKERTAMKRSTLLAGGLGLGVLALALLAYLARRPAPPSEPALAAAPAKEETPTPPLPPPAPRAEAASPLVSAPEVSPEPQVSLPVPTPDRIKPRPERGQATPAELRQQKQASLDLIESSIGRLEKERQSAEQAGDVETARRNQIRIERLRKRGEALRQEAAGPTPATEEPPAPGTRAPPSAP
jgi:TolA-binding protein